MPVASAQVNPPTRSRKIAATIIVIVSVVVVWKVIDYRMQPPPPAHPIGERQPGI